ncbi:MAG TPA: metallopeptidase family protein [Candidatus Paceibacterota bacterium]|nr:metallopeptidase family protein [Candidatus Paceibacterota bacterium]
MEGHDTEFEMMVATAYDKLPEWIRVKMKNIAITVEELVDSETVRDMDLDDHMGLLGLYRGVPQTKRSVSAGFEMPDTIVLYRLPILDEASDSGKSVEDVIFETLWHEIAHHFGLSEEDVMRREGEEFGTDQNPNENDDGEI